MTDFAAIAPMLPLTILKSIMACILLKYLIGWKSILAGVATFLVTFPANIIMSGRYGAVQMKLMALLDSRTATTTKFLHGIQQIKPGELVMFSRGTGSGKSLILQGIPGECHVLEGVIQRPQHAIQDTTGIQSAQENCWLLKNTTAFVPQNPWIEGGTLGENILFGLPYNEGRYQQVLSACALLPDLKALSDGDLTTLGSNKVNLSGGQKTRVALARALYSRADILVLDDILGGVDVGTRHHLVHFALMGDLAPGRTRVLATHHFEDCLKFADHVYRAEKGRVYEEDKQRLLIGFGNKVTRERANTRPQAEQGTREHGIRGGEEQVVSVDEERSSGPFKLGALGKFVQAGTGIVLMTMIVATSGAYLTLFLGRGLWIASWTRTAQRQPTNLGLVVNTCAQHGTDQPHDNMFHLKVYLVISLAMCLVSTVRYFVLLNSNLKASRYLFDRMLTAVISLPLAWSDNVPIGRIINRFTADFQSIDSNLGKNLGSAISGVLQIFGIILAATLALPVILLLALILLTVSVAVCYRYLKAAREMKRLEAAARSPVLNLLLSVTEDLVTIRGFGRVACYVDKMHQAVDRRTRALWQYVPLQLLAQLPAEHDRGHICHTGRAAHCADQKPRCICRRVCFEFRAPIHRRN